MSLRVTHAFESDIRESNYKQMLINDSGTTQCEENR